MPVAAASERSGSSSRARAMRAGPIQQAANASAETVRMKNLVPIMPPGVGPFGERRGGRERGGRPRVGQDREELYNGATRNASKTLGRSGLDPAGRACAQDGPQAG